jgi:hypothetical protein
VVDSVFEGVAVKITPVKREGAAPGLLSVIVSVYDFTGVVEKLPGQIGDIELPKIILEQVSFRIEAAAWDVHCIAPFSNPEATGAGSLSKAGGRTSLAVCIFLESAR